MIILGQWSCGVAGVVVEFGEEVVLDLGEGLGISLGDLGSGFGLSSGFLGFTYGASGLFGEEVVVGLGMGVALGDCGGDTGTWRCGGVGLSDRSGGAGSAGAMRGEALGDLLLKREGLEGRVLFSGGFVQKM